jgi:hypothetical protein
MDMIMFPFNNDMSDLGGLPSESLRREYDELIEATEFEGEAISSIPTRKATNLGLYVILNVGRSWTWPRAPERGPATLWGRLRGAGAKLPLLDMRGHRGGYEEPRDSVVVVADSSKMPAPILAIFVDVDHAGHMRIRIQQGHLMRHRRSWNVDGRRHGETNDGN